MKQKHGSADIVPSRSRRYLYGLSFVVLVLWLFLRAQIERLLRGETETVFYPLVVLIGSSSDWLSLLVLGSMIVAAHLITFRTTYEERLVWPSVVSGIVQSLLLIIGVIFMSSSLRPLQSLSTQDHMYQLMTGNYNGGIGAYGYYVVMECEPLGLICQHQQTFTYWLCFEEDGQIAIDPDTQALVFQVNGMTYPIVTDGRYILNCTVRGLSR